MHPKVLSPVEQKIVEGKPSLIEEVLCNQLNQQERSPFSKAQAQVGLKRIDRLAEAQLAQVFLSSPASKLVIEALQQGCSLRQAALVASIPVNTARKVLAVLHKTADVWLVFVMSLNYCVLQHSCHSV